MEKPANKRAYANLIPTLRNRCAAGAHVIEMENGEERLFLLLSYGI